MSDTDKDKPYWVTATWWEPIHWWCDRDFTRSWPPSRGRVRTCDLPERPVRAPLNRRRFSRVEDWHCDWAPVYEGRPYSHTPKWFTDHVWNNVERTSVRDDCRRAVAEYRATGEVDVIPSVRQHRHCAAWLWE